MEAKNGPFTTKKVKKNISTNSVIDLTRSMRKFFGRKRTQKAMLNFIINWIYANCFHFYQKLTFLRGRNRNFNMLQKAQGKKLSIFLFTSWVAKKNLNNFRFIPA